MAKKVLHLTYTLLTGGAERVIFNYATNHNAEKYVPVVCAIKDAGLIARQLKEKGIKVYCCTKKRGFDIKVLKFILNIIKNEHIDIIHVHNPNPNHYVALSMILSCVNVSIRTEHNIFYKGRVRSWYPILNTLLGLFNSKIVGVSEMLMNTHIKKDLLNKHKYTYIHNGIEKKNGLAEQFQGFDLGREKNKLNIAADAVVIGTVANIHKQKGIDMFLEAAKIVNAQYPETHFLIVGDGVLKEKMQTYAKQLSIEKKVSFAGYREDATLLMNGIDIFVLASLWEGFPITILEAMRAGKPCVVTDVGGNKEAVADGETGFVVPSKRPDLIADRINNLLASSEKRDKFGKAGKNVFESKFTVQAMVEKTEKIYDEILG